MGSISSMDTATTDNASPTMALHHQQESQTPYLHQETCLFVQCAFLSTKHIHHMEFGMFRSYLWSSVKKRMMNCLRCNVDLLENKWVWVTFLLIMHVSLFQLLKIRYLVVVVGSDCKFQPKQAHRVRCRKMNKAIG